MIPFLLWLKLGGDFAVQFADNNTGKIAKEEAKYGLDFCKYFCTDEWAHRSDLTEVNGMKPCSKDIGKCLQQGT